MTAGLTLDAVDTARVGDAAAVWEKVVNKLRTQSMPPAGRSRPDPATYEALRTKLEAELDRSAAAAPDPGKLPTFQRLTRTEYGNAIRDLLALEDLPKELDIDLLLPVDNLASGFDNLRDLLFVSSTQLERYLSAARKISRLAVGDPEVPPLIDTYHVPADLPQDGHVAGTPFGTRGGTVIRTNLPLDGEYAIEIAVARAAPEHQLEVSVDGERVQLLTLGEGNELSVRLPLKAGPRVVVVAFVQHTSARSQELVRPGLRYRNSSTQPSVSSVTINGPHHVTGVGDTPSRRRIFVCRPTGPSDEARCAGQILETLARRAYRRPVTDADIQPLLPFYEAGRAERDFDMGIQQALERVLVSPRFLFRIEANPNVPDGTVYRISDLELASRLSFFLWSSIPDDALLDLAAEDKLHDPEVLEQQVRRMLADPRSQSLVDNFAAQWLFLRDLRSKIPNPRFFRDFDAGLREAFARETELFLDSILRKDRSVLDLLDANYTFVNERLAKHYGIPGVYGSNFRRVTLGDDSPRRGLFGQGSILTVTSYATRTSVVLRGKYVLDNLLASPPPPPPPNIPALEVKSTQGEALTMREAMAQHRANPMCATCHARMDPLGLALENFDAVGQWRTRSESGKVIDATTTLLDGTTLDGVVGLRQELLRHPDRFVTAMTEKLLTFAVGRHFAYYDAPAVRKVVREAAGNDYRFSSMVLGIVNSVPFQMRRSESSVSVSASRQ
jgi:hypothetical protein